MTRGGQLPQLHHLSSSDSTHTHTQKKKAQTSTHNLFIFIIQLNSTQKKISPKEREELEHTPYAFPTAVHFFAKLRVESDSETLEWRGLRVHRMSVRASFPPRVSLRRSVSLESR